MKIMAKLRGNAALVYLTGKIDAVIISHVNITKFLLSPTHLPSSRNILLGKYLSELLQVHLHSYFLP